MSTTSTNFRLVLATTNDIVDVVAHVANNFSSLDSIIGLAHTGTGQLKPGLGIAVPFLSSPTISGTVQGSFSLTASTGSFNTITATGGAVSVNSFTIGTCGFPATAGANSTILTIITSNAVWAVSAPNTGANQALSNLAAVAFNTGIGTGSGGFFTFSRIVATSGSLTGLTVFQASTGTFAGNLAVTGTVNAAALNCTGGSITAANISIGTYALPPALGATGQVVTAVGATSTFSNLPAVYGVNVDTPIAYSTGTGAINATFAVRCTGAQFDLSGAYSTTTGLITFASKAVVMAYGSLGGMLGAAAGATQAVFVGIYKNGTLATTIASVSTTGSINYAIGVASPGTFSVITVTAGDQVGLGARWTVTNVGGQASGPTITGGSFTLVAIATQG